MSCGLYQMTRGHFNLETCRLHYMPSCRHYTYNEVTLAEPCVCPRKLTMYMQSSWCFDTNSTKRRQLIGSQHGVLFRRRFVSRPMKCMYTSNPNWGRTIGNAAGWIYSNSCWSQLNQTCSAFIKRLLVWSLAAPLRSIAIDRLNNSDLSLASSAAGI